MRPADATRSWAVSAGGNPTRLTGTAPATPRNTALALRTATPPKSGKKTKTTKRTLVAEHLTQAPAREAINGSARNEIVRMSRTLFVTQRFDRVEVRG